VIVTDINIYHLLFSSLIFRDILAVHYLALLTLFTD